MTHPLDASYASARTLIASYVAASQARRAETIMALRPRSADHLLVFEPEFAAEAAEHGYRQLWGNAPLWPVPPQPTFEVFCATSDALAAGHDDGRAFPGGYHEIGCWLREGVIWVAWSISAQGRFQSTLFDGLVEVEPGRWAWFPRPWKVLPNPPAPTLWWDE